VPEKEAFHTGYTRPELWNPHEDPSGTLQERSRILDKELQELRLKKQALSFAERIRIEHAYKEAVKKLWKYRIISTLAVVIAYFILNPFADIDYKTVIFTWLLLPMVDAWLREVREIDFYK